MAAAKAGVKEEIFRTAVHLVNATIATAVEITATVTVRTGEATISKGMGRAVTTAMVINLIPKLANPMGLPPLDLPLLPHHKIQILPHMLRLGSNTTKNTQRRRLIPMPHMVV